MAQEIQVSKKIVWVIPNMSEESIKLYENGKEIKSASFTVALESNITKWHLGFNPNGDNIEAKGHLGLFLHLEEHGSADFNIKYSFSIKGMAEKDTFTLEDPEKQKGSDFTSWGFPTFILFATLFNPADKFIVDDKITLICNITISKAEDISLIQDTPLIQPFGLDVEKMFEDKLFVDFEFKCSDGEVLKTHKFVLAARSPVFHAMLSNDMKEAKEGSAEVPDFNSITMKEVLRFMYCNKVNKIKKIVRDLIFAAEKYEMEGLKKMCIESLIASLTTENVLQSLLLAERISQGTKLFEKCIYLVLCNYAKIKKSEEWKQLPSDLLLKIIDRMMDHSNLTNTVHI